MRSGSERVTSLGEVSARDRVRAQRQDRRRDELLPYDRHPPATPADAPLLDELAALDSRRPPAPRCVDGTVRAALDLADGSAAADPFVRTAQLVALLRLRTRRLRGDHERGSRRERIEAQLHRPRRALSARI